MMKLVTCLLASFTIVTSLGVQSEMQRDLENFDETNIYHDEMEDKEFGHVHKRVYEDEEEEEDRKSFNPFDRKRSTVTPIKTFKAMALTSHNAARKRHGVPALKYNANLESHAIRYATKLASTRTFQHDNAELLGYVEGENLFKGYSSKPSDICEASFDWYNEIKDFDWSLKSTKYNFWAIPRTLGHFTQMIWAGTTEVGCGGSYTKSDEPRLGPYVTYIVCRYKKPGNQKIQFPQNVKPLLAGAPPYFKRYSDVCPSCSDEKTDCAGRVRECGEAFFVGATARSECKKTCGIC